MRKLLFTFLFAITSALAFAEVKPESVLLTIDGRDITAGEFLYAYNKNGSFENAVEKKSVAEYLEMFINYKLKVAAALEERMDTLTSFNKEFRTYRDMQLYPYLIDQEFIDSVALDVYNRTKTHLGGKDLLRPAHILIRLSQKSTPGQQSAAKAMADSIYNLLIAGGNFEELAKTLSQDPGTAKDGGLLPWIGPGNTIKEFEEVAYSLQPGEMSKPFLSPVGYHIVVMKERKSFEPFEVLRPEIVEALKKQGIEDAAAEAKIKKIMAKGVAREEVMNAVIRDHVPAYSPASYLIQEYYDGLLSYEITNKNVYSKAADEGLMAAYYADSKKIDKNKYTWSEPRFKGYIYQCKNKKQEKSVRKFLKKAAKYEDLRSEVKKTFNKDSVMVKITGPYLAKKGENKIVDEFIFKGEKAKRSEKFPVIGVVGKKIKKPQDYTDVKAQVTSGLQELLEKDFVQKLRARYTVVKNEAVLQELIAQENQ